MKAKHYVAVLAIGTLLIPTLWAVVYAMEKPDIGVWPQSRAEQINALRGLKRVAVIVEPIRSKAEQLGLTREAIRVDTERQMRQHGIDIRSQQEWLSNKSVPFLDVEVIETSLDENSPIVALSIGVRLYEAVSPVRDPAIQTLGVTWEVCVICPVGRARLFEIRDRAKGVVAMFIHEYLAANPKQPAPTPETRGSEAKQR